jgi:tetratricopeptide (TPR) repeat protein
VTTTDPLPAQRRKISAGFAIVLLTIAAYLPSLFAGFIWDDEFHVMMLPEQRTVDGLKRIWNPQVRAMPQYYPVTHTSFWIESQLWGLEPLGYHAVNIALQAANALLLWTILRRIEVPGAFWIALLFAVHPVQVETVAWVSERKNLLSAFFYLTAALLFIRASDDEKRVLLRYAAPTVCFIAAVLSKSVTCTLPAALVLVQWGRRRRISTKQWIVLGLWLAIGAAAGLNTAHIEQHSVGASGEEWALTFPQRVLVAGRAIWTYAAKAVAPWPLSFIYRKWPVNVGAPLQWAFPVGIVIAVAALFAARRWIGRWPTVGALYFVGTLFPALGFFNVYPMRYSYVADHFQYLAIIGMLGLLVASFRFLVRRDQYRSALLLLIVFAFAGATCWRCFVFHDRESLWRDTIAKNPEAWMAYANLGAILNEENRDDEAAGALSESLRLHPNQAEAHLVLGDLFFKRGELAHALEQYRAAAEQAPQNFRTHAAIAKVLVAQQKLDEAQTEYRRAVELEPRYIEGRAALASVLYRLSRGNDSALLDAAIEQMRQAIVLSADNATLHNNLGVYLEARGEFDEALKQYQTAARLSPDNRAATEAAKRVREKIHHD